MSARIPFTPFKLVNVNLRGSLIGCSFEGFLQGETGKPEGYGEAFFNDKSTYAGCFLNGEMEGMGTFSSQAGARYEGEWKQGFQHGYGRSLNTDGAVYEGEWSHGQRSGVGQYGESSVGVLFAGRWEKGCPSGRCFAQLAPIGSSESRIHFVGDFSRQGDEHLVAIGRMRNTRSGRWNPEAMIEEDYCGQVLSVWRDEMTDVENFGRVDSLMREGLGVLKWSSVQIPSPSQARVLPGIDGSRCEAATYEGEFESAVPHGYGILTDENCGCYRGEFKNGEFHGMGAFEFKDGSQYFGNWKSNKRNGFGVMKSASNEQRLCFFSNGLEEASHFLQRSEGLQSSLNAADRDDLSHRLSTAVKIDSVAQAATHHSRTRSNKSFIITSRTGTQLFGGSKPKNLTTLADVPEEQNFGRGGQTQIKSEEETTAGANSVLVKNTEEIVTSQDGQHLFMEDMTSSYPNPQSEREFTGGAEELKRNSIKDDAETSRKAALFDDVKSDETPHMSAARRAGDGVLPRNSPPNEASKSVCSNSVHFL
uniref:Uncharacterized protein n=1 Tax=Palpitomonas bilix TaxID=652834 RepID=A0A7S3DK68_9EUKA|mmetsp:Transcript_41247/g.106700  ORF Transcript_41247/g.106700 Transcript_41247/m.106700 type:complete len:534 (+) Transcript_41247:70-1671(+)